MDKSKVIKLIDSSYTSDEIGQQIATETSREVFCAVASIGSNEFYQASTAGLNPEYKLTMFYYDYHGEDIAEVNGQRYSIYRTFISKYEEIELYLAKKVGV